MQRSNRLSHHFAQSLATLLEGLTTQIATAFRQQIEEDNSHYIKALELSDKAALEEKEDVDEMKKMIRAMLARQLLSVIDAAGPISN